jgi:hypothetical protein
MFTMMKKYACLYGEMDFTPAEQQELGRFTAELVKVATTGTEDELVQFFRKEFEGIDQETFDRINGMVDFLSTQEKNAQIGATIGAIMAPIALGLTAAPMLISGVKSLLQNRELKNSLELIYKQHPELKRDPNVPAYFQAISDFAPAIAKNPVIAGNLLAQWHAAGPMMATPQIIKELTEVQKNVGGMSPASTSAIETGKAGAGIAQALMR